MAIGHRNPSQGPITGWSPVFSDQTIPAVSLLANNVRVDGVTFSIVAVPEPSLAILWPVAVGSLSLYRRRQMALNVEPRRAVVK